MQIKKFFFQNYLSPGGKGGHTRSFEVKMGRHSTFTKVWAILLQEN